MFEVVTTISLWELVRHATTWLVNLKRAHRTRQVTSRQALRKVIVASRKTRAYLKLLSDGGRPAHQVESELTMVWTELSFALQDLKIDKLATRCNSAGALWADMAKLDDQQLKKTTASLIRIEQLATRLLESVEQ